MKGYAPNFHSSVSGIPGLKMAVAFRNKGASMPRSPALECTFCGGEEAPSPGGCSSLFHAEAAPRPPARSVMSLIPFSPLPPRATPLLQKAAILRVSVTWLRLSREPSVVQHLRLLFLQSVQGSHPLGREATLLEEMTVMLQIWCKRVLVVRRSLLSMCKVCM